jgi:hypothetical protein
LADARAAAHQDLNAVLATATQAHTPPDGAALTGLADQLEQIVASESPEQAKELMGLLLKEIRVHDGRRIVPTYRVPAAVRAIPSKVELGGLEPPTSWVRCQRGSGVSGANPHLEPFPAVFQARRSWLFLDFADHGVTTHEGEGRHRIALRPRGSGVEKP